MFGGSFTATRDTPALSFLPRFRDSVTLQQRAVCSRLPAHPYLSHTRMPLGCLPSRIKHLEPRVAGVVLLLRGCENNRNEEKKSLFQGASLLTLQTGNARAVLGPAAPAPLAAAERFLPWGHKSQGGWEETPHSSGPAASSKRVFLEVFVLK